MVVETYQDDLELFQKLSLKPFKTTSQKQFVVGRYRLKNYKKAKIKIYVTCMPAQFWRFEVETDEGHKFNIKTGSGYLSDYWDSVIKVAIGAFVVTEIHGNNTETVLYNTP